jgi:hypothetical protein
MARRVTSWIGVGALAATGAFAALAGHATHVAARTPRTAPTTTPSSSGATNTLPGSGSDNQGSDDGFAPPDTSPAFTPQPPVVASGGS